MKRYKRSAKGDIYTRTFMNLMEGALPIDWFNMADFDRLYKQVYLYEMDSRSARHPDPGEVPWPIIYALSRYHAKHQFCSRKLPDIHKIGLQVQNFLHKVEWAWLFKDMNKARPSVSVKNVTTPACKSIDYTHHIRRWTTGMMEAIMTEAASVQSHARHTSHNNMIPLTKLGLKLLQEGPLQAIPTDKDGGFCLHLRKDMLPIVHGILIDKGMYRFYGHRPLIYTDLAHRYTTLCYKVERLEEEAGRARALLRSLYNEGASLVADLNLTCKTHKPSGQVGHRNIHANPCYSFKGLGLWLARELRAHTHECQHLLRDTQDFCQKISRVQAKPEHRLLRLDIKDFFMSGSAGNIIGSLKDTLPNDTPRSNTILEVLDLLLEAQFIETKIIPREIYIVEKGTGMGLPHSGDVADTSFYSLAEESWVHNLATRTKCSIVAYWRFKDDIFFILENWHSFRTFLRKFMADAQFFKIEVEGISKYRCTFLDVEVAKQGTKYICVPYIKASNVGVPLGLDSAHPWHTHRSWPSAYLRRLESISSEPMLADGAKSLFKERLHMHCHNLEALDLQIQMNKPRVGRQKPKWPEWLPLSFHPSLVPRIPNAIRAYLGSVSAKAAWHSAWGSYDQPSIKVAWKSGFSSHASMAQR